MPSGIKISKPSESNIAPNFNKIGKPLKDILDKASGEAETFRQIYYNVGKKFGKKFKPWEAVKGGEKAAKYAGKLGKAIPLIMVALDAYSQYREEKGEEDRARYLATLRSATRNFFIDQAKINSEIFEEIINNVSSEYVRVSLESLEEKETDIILREKNHHDIKAQITQIRRKCSALRNELYFGSTQYFGDGE